MNLKTHNNNPRATALAILRGVENGLFADMLLDHARLSLDDRDRAFLLELVYGTLRNRALLDHALNALSAAPVEKTDAWTRNILRLGAYQLLFLDRVPASAAVNTSVELAKMYGKKHGYVNGLLRNLDRKRSGLALPGRGDGLRYLTTRYSHPAWLVRRWMSRYGAEKAERILAGNNTPAPLVIRTNTLKTTREALKTALRAEGVDVQEAGYSPEGLVFASPVPLRSLNAYKDGLFMVQDEAAQLVSLLLSPAAGAAVLDACAAPGGKATHLAALMNNQGSLIALENDRARIVRLHENSVRLAATIIAPVQADAAAYDGGPFDAILIDAPCSGLGVLRRHPDGRWNKKEESIGERALLQQRILDHCAGLLKPGGALVYATCTTEPEENEDNIRAFLAGSGRGFVMDDPRPFLPERASELVDAQGFLRTHLNDRGMDGFFGARLVKKA